MRRTVRSLIVALVLGAATTVAAAWLMGNLPRLRPELPVVTATRGDGLRQVTVTPYSYGRFYFIVSHRIVDYVGQHRDLVAELEQRRAEGAWVTMPRALDDRAWGETRGWCGLSRRGTSRSTEWPRGGRGRRCTPSVGRQPSGI